LGVAAAARFHPRVEAVRRVNVQVAGPAAAIAAGVDVLRGGGIVAFPTDTLYGLAVDPRNDEAVRRLFELKGRDAAVAVPLIAANEEQARTAGMFGDAELRLAKAFWPGPLTIVVPASPALSRDLLARGTTVAIRVPAHDTARALAEGLGYCVTSTSANRAGGPAVEDPARIDAEILEGIDLLIDDGPSPGGPPSTIVEVTRDGLRLVRAGAVAWDRVIRSAE
jgi:L-threonylcarbamoyladenylate synthase